MASADLARAVGKYRLLELLATGGMGEVFLALTPDTPPKRIVIKRMLRHLADDKAFVRLFLNEARLAAILSHPNVVQILELGLEEGLHYKAMEFVHGRSLRAIDQRARKRGEKVPAPVVTAICAQALAGLHYAHEFRDAASQISGVIHRDVSPDNVLVGFDGVVKLVDFGIAKAVRQDDTTRTGVLKGKLAYMAPEQLEGREIDRRADLYGMGVVLYEVLAQSRPFTASTEALLIHRVLSGEKPTPLRSVNPGISPELETTVMRALANDPEARFESASAMASALNSGVAQAEIAAYLAELFGDEARLPPEDEPGKIAGTVALAQAAGTQITPSDVAPPTQVSAPPESPRRRWVAPAAVASLAVIAAGLAVALHQSAPVAVTTSEPPLAVAAAEIDAGRSEVARGPPPVVIALPDPVDTPALTPTKDHPRKSTKPGKVVFRVYPWAEVFYKGKSLGITPIAPFETPAGAQVFTLKNSQLGQEKEVRVQVREGAVTSAKVDFLTR